MANTAQVQQADSTTYHGHGHANKPATADTWAAATMEAAVSLQTLALAAGGMPQQPVRAWLNGRQAVHEALAKVVAAVEFGAVCWQNATIDAVQPREKQATEVLQREGWAWTSPSVGWMAPAPATRVAYERAAACLTEMGWKWSPENKAWLAPQRAEAPVTGCEWPEGAAADLVRSLGYVWIGGKWENQRPAPSVLDMPLGVRVVIGRGSSDAVPIDKAAPVRLLVEQADTLHAKVHRLEYAARSARERLEQGDATEAIKFLNSVV